MAPSFRMKSIIFSLMFVLVANVCPAEWEILDVHASTRTRESSYQGPPEIELSCKIRNTSNRSIFIWGQDWGGACKFYLIESYIRERDTAAWERQNAAMCGSLGKIGWIEVKPGEVIQSVRTTFQSHVGRQMILTFRRAFTELDSSGSTILLGPFAIPEPKPDKRETASAS